MSKMSGGAIAVLAVLIALLGFALYIMFAGWDVGPGRQGGTISPSGYLAMALGIVFTLVIGVGLMTLIFYSNKHGRD